MTKLSVATSSQTNHTFFYTLETLRGIAAFTIAIYHFNRDFGGHLAVDFFFLLSGFVLAHNYLYRDRMQAWWFIKQRFYRLYPLHIFTLFTFVAAFYLYFNGLPNYPDGRWETFVQQMLLLQNVGLSPLQLSWNYPSWSISVEFVTGVVFVLLIRKSTWNSILIIASLICFIFLYRASPDLNVHRQNIYHYYNIGIIRCLGSFLIGVLVYRCYQYALKQPWYNKFAQAKTNHRLSYVLTSLLEAVLMVLPFILAVCRPHKNYITDYFAPLLFAVMVFVYAFEAGFVSRIMNKLKYLGEISYSLYLNQVTVLLLMAYSLELAGVFPQNALRKLYQHGYPGDTGRTFYLIVFLVLLIIYSHFTYRYVESPIRRWVKRNRKATTENRTLN